jgi:hypothetical protein
VQSGMEKPTNFVWNSSYRRVTIRNMATVRNFELYEKNLTYTVSVHKL